jgi:N6-L-threonylcarbamoyladenine synthase
MKNGSIIGLGLESSCDETAAAILADGRDLRSNVIASQIEIHREYNGVVPEIASRAHLEMINQIIDSALAESGVSFEDIDYVAATARPGLVGSLLIAMQSAKAISYVSKIPLIAVNHLEAHLSAAFIEHPELNFPYIGLLVSGGNTALYHVTGPGEMLLLGRSTDDSIGEAYDKVSKYLNLGYPGGPVIDSLAGEAVKKEHLFPRMLLKTEGYDFSYSGLKTAVINFLKEYPDSDVREIAWAFQESALELLTRRLFAASNELGINTIVVAGGVAANSRLRELMKEKAGEKKRIIIPSPVLCTDNAAMVACAGYFYHQKGEFSGLDVDVSPRVHVRKR